MPTPFSKCGKKVKDLLKKGYEKDRTVTLKTKTPSGVTYTTKGVLGSGKDGKMAGSLEASYKHPSGFHIDKFAASSAHKFDADISLNDQADGLKFTLGVTVEDFLAKGDNEKSEVGVEYSNDQMNLLVTAKTDPSADFKSSADFLVGFGAFSVGMCASGKLADVKDDTGKTSKTWSTGEYGAVMGYSMDSAEMTLSASKKFSVFSAGFLHNYSKDMTFGTIVDYDTAKPDNKDKVSIKAGGKYVLDSETTFQAMVDKNAKLSLSYSQFLRPMVKLTTSACVDMKFVNDGVTGGSSPTTFGCCLDLGDL